VWPKHAGAQEKASMSITKKLSEKANSKSLKGNYSQRFVVPEAAIRNFVGSLNIRDIDTAAARMQMVADVTQYELDSPIDELDQSAVELINRLAGESTNKHYRRIMRAILASITKGTRGIDEAHRTAGHAVELAFSWSLPYFTVLNLYRDTLRKMRQTPKRN
jgi:hypothetical protein